MHMVEPVLSLLGSLDLQVQCELLRELVRFPDVTPAILEGLIAALKPSTHEYRQAAAPSDTGNTAEFVLFSHQAAAAKAIGSLALLFHPIAVHLVKLQAIHGLLSTAGNHRYADSQRQAALAIAALAKQCPCVVRCMMGHVSSTIVTEILHSPTQFHARLSPAQLDVLVTNTVHVEPGSHESANGRHNTSTC